MGEESLESFESFEMGRGDDEREEKDKKFLTQLTFRGILKK